MKFLIPALALASCAVGPDYQKPETVTPATYKAVGLSSPPPVGDWWSGFADAKLANLLSQAERANPESRAALARLDQSRAILGLSRSDLLPTLTGEALAQRQEDSQNGAFGGDFGPQGPYSNYRSALNLDYEIDLWGRVRRSISQQEALTQAAAADYVSALLSTKAEVARDYLTLRHLDSEISLFSDTIKLREENEKLVESRVEAGATSSIDSARAKSLTETARAELFRLKNRRDELENAIGVLVGQNPSTFRLAAAAPPRIPSIPAGAPGDLLRRRPDVAATERRLAAAAEEIGITIAKYLPRISLSGSGGFSAIQASDLFNKKSRLWNIGPSATFPIVTFGRSKKDREGAEAAYREALENHRLSVLNAFREVENALSGISNLDRALAAQERSTAASKEAARLIELRYDTGLVSFFEVLDSQRELLTEERSLVQTRSARHLATVQLIQALGGGWK